MVALFGKDKEKSGQYELWEGGKLACGQKDYINKEFQ